MLDILRSVLREEEGGDAGTGSAGGAAPAEGAKPGEGEGEGAKPGEGEGAKPGEGEGEGAKPGEGEGEGAKPGEGEGAKPGEGDKTGEGEGEGEGEGDKTGAPETYGDFDIPEELKAYVDDKTVDSFKELAKSMDLTQEQAQNLVDYQINQQKDLIEIYSKQGEQWEAAVREDEEIGGADFEIKKAKAIKAFDHFATDEFKTLMNPYHPVDNPKGMGLGDHPEVVRLFYRIGLSISEDGYVNSHQGGEVNTKLDREDVMYPSMTGATKDQ